MARYAIIKNDLIDNVIVADSDFVEIHYPEAIECPLEFGVGDEYKDGEFKKLSVVVIEEEVTE